MEGGGGRFHPPNYALCLLWKSYSSMVLLIYHICIVFTLYTAAPVFAFYILLHRNNKKCLIKRPFPFLSKHFIGITVVLEWKNKGGGTAQYYFWRRERSFLVKIWTSFWFLSLSLYVLILVPHSLHLHYNRMIFLHFWKRNNPFWTHISICLLVCWPGSYTSMLPSEHLFNLYLCL